MRTRPALSEKRKNSLSESSSRLDRAPFCPADNAGVPPCSRRKPCTRGDKKGGDRARPDFVATFCGTANLGPMQARWFRDVSVQESREGTQAGSRHWDVKVYSCYPLPPCRTQLLTVPAFYLLPSCGRLIVAMASGTIRIEANKALWRV